MINSSDNLELKGTLQSIKGLLSKKFGSDASFGCRSLLGIYYI